MKEISKLNESTNHNAKSKETNKINSQLKEITFIKTSSFSLIVAIIQVFLSFLTAVSFLIIYLATGSFTFQIGIFLDFFLTLGFASIIISPIATFFMTVALCFFSILVYNILAQRMGGIKFKMMGNEITNIPVVPFSLMLSVIIAIWGFILGLVLGISLAVLNVLPGLTPAFNQLTFGLIPVIINSINTTFPPVAGLGGALSLIIGLPVVVFIIAIIDVSIIVLLYNYVGSRAAYFQLNFTRVKDKTYKLISIPAGPITLVSGVISGVLGLLIVTVSFLGFIDLVNVASAWTIIGLVLSRDDLLIYLIPYILIATLIAIFYNILAPRIGGIKLKLE